MQNDLEKLENWSEVNEVKFNEDMCEVLRLGRKSQMQNGE